jgi:hypothetical protein
LRLAFAVVPAGCGSPHGDVPLSPLDEDTVLLGRVVENRTDCIVDADCTLLIEFSDTTIHALYGTGERPAPPCEIEPEVADAAFDLEPGDLVRTIIANCRPEGYFLRQIEADPMQGR